MAHFPVGVRHFSYSIFQQNSIPLMYKILFLQNSKMGPQIKLVKKIIVLVSSLNEKFEHLIDIGIHPWN